LTFTSKQHIIIKDENTGEYNMKTIEPILMLGPFHNAWMQFDPELAPGVINVSKMDVAEMLIYGAPKIVLAFDEDVTVDALTEAVKKCTKPEIVYSAPKTIKKRKKK
jgi:hypothetical protein